LKKTSKRGKPFLILSGGRRKRNGVPYRKNIFLYLLNNGAESHVNSLEKKKSFV